MDNNYLRLLPEELIDIIISDIDIIDLENIRKLLDIDLHKLMCFQLYPVFKKYSSNKSIRWECLYYQLVINTSPMESSVLRIFETAMLTGHGNEILRVYLTDPDFEKDKIQLESLVNRFDIESILLFINNGLSI